MYEEHHFRTFPPRTVSAYVKTDIEKHGKDTMIYREWLRCHFRPQFEKLQLYPTVIDRIRAREVLTLSEDWCHFERMAHGQQLAPEAREDLRQHTQWLLQALGQYWRNYFRGLERREPRVIWAEIEGWVESSMNAWFRSMQIDAKELQQRLARGGDDRYWQIFRMGLISAVFVLPRDAILEVSLYLDVALYVSRHGRAALHRRPNYTGRSGGGS